MAADEHEQRAPASLVAQVLTGAERVGEVVARAAVAAHRRSAVAHAEQVEAAGTPVVLASRRVVAQHVSWARRQGAAAGATLSALEVTSLWGTAGTLTVPAALTGFAADVTSLAWVQARMVVHLAVLHGRDPDDAEVLVADLLALWEIDSLSDAVRGDRMRWTRVLGRLAGPVGRVRTLLRLVGLRSVARRLVPIANVPLSAAANARATEALGRRAERHYRLVGDDLEG